MADLTDLLAIGDCQTRNDWGSFEQVVNENELLKNDKSWNMIHCSISFRLFCMIYLTFSRNVIITNGYLFKKLLITWTFAKYKYTKYKIGKQRIANCHYQKNTTEQGQEQQTEQNHCKKNDWIELRIKHNQLLNVWFGGQSSVRFQPNTSHLEFH